MVAFQALSWEARDDEDAQSHVVSIIGKTEDGRSVCVTTEFEPYLFIRLPARSGQRDAQEYYHAIDRACPGALTSYAIEYSKDVWGFTNNEEFPFLRLGFKTLTSRVTVASFLRYRRLELASRGQVDVKLYENNLEPCLRLMHQSGIEATGWLEAEGDAFRPTTIARVDVDLWCDDWTALKPLARNDIAPFVVASFDIECNSSTGKFPDASVEDDACFQIGISLCKFGSDEPYDKTILCYKQTDPALEGTNVVSFDTEGDMLMAFSDYLHEHSVDILTGWNIFGFDLDYIHTRAARLCDVRFFQLGRLKNTPCHIVKKKLSSSALGDNELKLLPMSGRFIFDMFHEVKKNYKLDSYKLDFVSKKYLGGDGKIDMAPREMFKRFREGDAVLLREVAEYCVKDTLLPHRLMKKLCTMLNLWEMARATWVPLNYLTERGQQIKVFSLLTRKARELGFKVPYIKYGSTAEGYVGATVLEAQSGAYYGPITALDFASLYPSIMMAHNLCYSTLVLDDLRYGNIEGVTYETFKVGKDTYKFAQNVPSLLPVILNDLKAYRKKAKKDMAAASGFMKQVFDGKQLAFKVSMNSIYGFTGASKGILPCMAIASTTTARGREMIQETKDYVETNFPGAKVRYGDTDSVMVEFDVQGRTGQDAINYSWELGERASKECTALFKKPNDLELEKIYCPFFLYSKKRYAAKLYEKNKSGDVVFKYVDIKGLQLVRRDNTPHVREVLRELLDVILESSDPAPPIDLARQRAQELLTGDVPHEKLVLSQSLSDTYKVKGERVSITAYDSRANNGIGRYLSEDINMAHVQVMHKMRERKPGSEPQSGDRVPYLLTVVENNRAAKAFEKAEDPAWVAEHGIPVDYVYYFTQKFLKPICDLLEPLVENPKEEIFGELMSLHKPSRKKKDAAPTQKLTMLDFFKKV